MRKLGITLLALALLAPGALAAGRDAAVEIAQEAAPGAEFVRARLDDGVYEVELRDGDERVRVDVLDATGAVLEIETAHPDAGRGAKFAISEADARAAAAKVAPEAERGIVTREREADGSAYEVFYAEPGAVGEVTVNAETGAIVRQSNYPDAAQRGVLSVERVRELVNGKRAGAEIAELELDWDDGRWLYEGEATANGARYSFELDAMSGKFKEFERDD